MPFKDLRDWIGKLRDSGDLWVIEKEVNPEPDIGAIGRAICEAQGPGALIKKVKGYSTPVTIGLHAAWRRVALALDLPPTATHEKVMDRWVEGMTKYPLKSKAYSDGACKENVLKGEQVDLFKFPLHRLNIGDASFYISKGCTITREPENGSVNVGMYRVMVLKKNKLSVMINFDQHAGRHLIKQEERGKPFEIAIAVGTDPVLPMVAGAKVPYGWNEYDYTGAVTGSPYELTQAESVDLPVPRNAEIVLEGVIKPNTRTLEGPFGEFPGAYTNYVYSPVIELTAVTHRNDPIFDNLYIGRPNTENHYMTMDSKLSAIFYGLKRDLPMITRMSYLKPYVHVVVIQGRWTHTAQPKQALNALFGSPHGSRAKVAVVVDEDVDPWNAEEVLWAMATRISSPNDIVLQTGTQVSLDPAAVHGMSCKIGIDATKPRPPMFRYMPLDWVLPPEGTDKWKSEMPKSRLVQQ